MSNQDQAAPEVAAEQTQTISIGFKNALDFLAPTWLLDWQPAQVELARQLYALGMRDASIFAQASQNHVHTGLEAAKNELKVGLEWLQNDLGQPGFLQSALATSKAAVAKAAEAEAAPTASSDPAQVADSVVDLGNVDPAAGRDEEEYVAAIDDLAAQTEVPPEAVAEEAAASAEVARQEQESMAADVDLDDLRLVASETVVDPVPEVQHQPV